MRKAMAFVIAALLMFSATAALASVEIEMVAYQESTRRICDTGLSNGEAMTMKAKYEQLVRAMDRDGVGLGRGGNFWGPTQPELLYDYCHQGGTDGGS
jgi:hypothetical protein